MVPLGSGSDIILESLSQRAILEEIRDSVTNVLTAPCAAERLLHLNDLMVDEPVQ
jgi:hypothetical protein